MKHCDSIYDELENLISKNLFDNKEIILFGANKSSKQMNDFLVEKGYEIQAVIDNDKRKWEQKPFGIMTYAPEEYLQPFRDNRIILIVSQYYGEMTAQLERMGYILNQHIFIVQKLFRKYDTSLEAFESFEKSVLAGEELYLTIRKDCSDASIFICPYIGNGDIYIIGLYLEQYIKEKQIQDYIVTVVGGACAKIGKMFSWKNIIALTQEESDALVAYVRLAGLQSCGTYILNDCYQQVVNRRFRGYKGTDFRMMFQKVVFGLDNDCRREISLNSEFETYTEQLGIEKGKAIILSPYANTITNIPMPVWEELAQQLSDRGYQVYTNSSGDEEAVNPFSKPLFAPFSIMKQLVEYAGCFIGVRSGLCDVISNAEAKKIILYPTGMLFGSCSTYDYFSLNKMGLCDDAVELEYGNEDYDILVGEILKVL